MHSLYEKADAASKDVYLAALEVRRVVGNGTMLEKVYQKCLQHELQLMGHKAEMEKFKAQTLTYLKLANLPLGMVINFGSDGFGKRGIHRVILKGASAPEGQERKVIQNPIMPPDAERGGCEAYRGSESLFLRAPSGACVPLI